MRKTTIGKPFLALTLLASVLACKAPTKTELEGAWVVSADSRDALPSQFREAVAQLVLDTDGSFHTQQLPLDVEFLGVAPLLTGFGVWRLDVRGWDHWVQLNFQSVNGEEEDFGFRLQVSSFLSGPSLYFFWGDVDLGGSRVTLRKE